MYKTKKIDKFEKWLVLFILNYHQQDLILMKRKKKSSSFCELVELYMSKTVSDSGHRNWRKSRIAHIWCTACENEMRVKPQWFEDNWVWLVICSTTAAF